MAEATDPPVDALRALLADVEGLRSRIGEVHALSGYEDLEHATLALEIVRHALDETLHHTGLGGHIEPTQDAEVRRRVDDWLETLRGVRAQAGALLATHPNEDLETALKALLLADGSLQEVAERYA
jgi:hypothetical protein